MSSSHNDDMPEIPHLETIDFLDDGGMIQRTPLVHAHEVSVFGSALSIRQVILGTVFGILVSGVVLGFALQPPSVDPPPWDRISSVIGWWYFTAWSVSFFPQIYLNYCRKCVYGQSFDYVGLNMLGFSCLAIYTVSFHFVPSVQEDYRKRFGNENNVDLNDVGFAALATMGTAYNVWQIFVYDRAGQVYSRTNLIGIGATCAVFAAWGGLLLFGVHTERFFTVLDILYGMSVVKIVVSLIKYIPQIHLNYKRQMTIGWNIWNVLLDFTGGSLSVTQQLIDCGTTGRWNGIAGNFVKCVLGLLVMSCSVVFIVQHCWLYKHKCRVQSAKEDAIRSSIEQTKAGGSVIEVYGEHPNEV